MSKELKKIPEVKVFGLWPTAGIEAEDPGLKRYISARPILLPHTSGRHEHQRFRKSTINVVERLIDDMIRARRRRDENCLRWDRLPDIDRHSASAKGRHSPETYHPGC